MPYLAPDVVLIDLELSGKSRVETIKELKGIMPEGNILVLIVYDDRNHLFPALQAGARGYLLKDSSPSEIIEAIQEVHNGGALMSARVARSVIEYFHDSHESWKHKEISLTEREKEILKDLIDGFTYRKLAKKLGISPHTVRTHIKKIYEKLHVSSKAEAINKAKKKGILWN